LYNCSHIPLFIRISNIPIRYISCHTDLSIVFPFQRYPVQIVIQYIYQFQFPYHVYNVISFIPCFIHIPYFPVISMIYYYYHSLSIHHPIVICRLTNCAYIVICIQLEFQYFTFHIYPSFNQNKKQISFKFQIVRKLNIQNSETHHRSLRRTPSWPIIKYQNPKQRNLNLRRTPCWALFKYQNLHATSRQLSVGHLIY